VDSGTSLRAIDLITRAGRERSRRRTIPTKAIALPAVTVDRGTLKLIDRDGRTATIEPLDVSGKTRRPRWCGSMTAHVEQRLKLTGQVSTRRLCGEHDVAVCGG